MNKQQLRKKYSEIRRSVVGRTEKDRQIAEKLQAKLKQDFVAERKGIVHFATLNDIQKAQIIKQNSLYGKVVCRCETVTEGEIVDCITRPLGAKDMDGVRRRTRAGMGRCQSGFCTPRIVQILSRELGEDVTEITKFGRKSHITVGRIK